MCPNYSSVSSEINPTHLKEIKNINRLIFFYNEKEVLICLIREDGSLHLDTFKSDKIKLYYAYGNGLGGYTVEASFPNDLFLSLDQRLDQYFKKIEPEDLGFKTLESSLGYVVESSENALNKPAISIECAQGLHRETICIPFEEPLKWPVLNGAHLVSFESSIVPLSYSVRLQQARTM